MKKILFIGNSHTYFNDMPRMVQELFMLSGEKVDVTMLTQGGMTLDWHRQNPQTAFNLRYGNYDYCVLQQAAHPFDGYDALSKGADDIRALAPGLDTKFVLYMTWAEKAKPENQAEMTAAYRKTAALSDFLLAPVGDLWQEFRAEHPEIELYFEDGAHASPAGSYLAACTLFHILGGEMGKTAGKLPEDGVVNALSMDVIHTIWRFVRNHIKNV